MGCRQACREREEGRKKAALTRWSERLAHGFRYVTLVFWGAEGEMRFPSTNNETIGTRTKPAGKSREWESRRKRPWTSTNTGGQVWGESGCGWGVGKRAGQRCWTGFLIFWAEKERATLQVNRAGFAWLLLRGPPPALSRAPNLVGPAHILPATAAGRKELGFGISRLISWRAGIFFSLVFLCFRQAADP